MKVCIFLPNLEIGGSERRMVLLAEQLKNNGHEVEVCTLREIGNFVELVRELNISRHTVNKGGRYDLLIPFFHLLRYFKTKQFDVVLSCLPSANLYAVTSKIAAPKTQLIWGLASSKLLLSDYGLWAKASYYVQKLVSRFVNSVVINSFCGQQAAIVEGYEPEKLQVIHNGVDIEKFAYSQKKRKAWRKLHGIPENALVIGRVGRLDPSKDYDVFLQACEITHQKNNAIWFVIVGGGKDAYARTTLNKIKKHSLMGKRLIHIMHERDMAAAYSAFDVATVTSKSESLPNALVEALSCDRMAVVTDVGDCKYVLSSFGEICKVGDAHTIANSWLSVIEKTNHNYSVDGSYPELKQYINKNFSVDKMTQKFEELCISLINKQVEK